MEFGERYARLQGGALPHIRNVGDLFVGGLCHSCGAPIGGRTDEALCVVYADAREAPLHAASAVLPDHASSTLPFTLALPLCSERLAEWLDVGQPGAFRWRAVEVDGKKRHPLFELVGSRLHLDFVRLAGDRWSAASCAACGWSDEPTYGLDSWMPESLLQRGFPALRGRPVGFLRSQQGEQGGERVFTVGRWFGKRFGFCMREDVWTKLAKSRRDPISGLVARALEAVPESMQVR